LPSSSYENWNEGPRRRWRPRSRAGGCLAWLLVLIVVLVVLALMFGGFQKGTKSGSLAPAAPLVTSVQLTS